jgi:hypothetical protein
MWNYQKWESHHSVILCNVFLLLCYMYACSNVDNFNMSLKYMGYSFNSCTVSAITVAQWNFFSHEILSSDVYTFLPVLLKCHHCDTGKWLAFSFESRNCMVPNQAWGNNCVLLFAIFSCTVWEVHSLVLLWWRSHVLLCSTGLSLFFNLFIADGTVQFWM